MKHHCHTNLDNHSLPPHLNLLFIGIGLNVLFVFIEVTYGFIAHSSALLSDATHNLGDVFTLSLALIARYLLRIQSTSQRTYGWRGFSIASSFFSSFSLIVILIFIFIKSVYNFFHPESVSGITVSIVAGIGVIINFLTAIVLFKGKDHDLNIKVAYLHMLADGLISLSVVISGIVIYYTEWFIVDPILSIGIIVFVLYSTVKVCIQSAHLLFGGVPNSLDMTEISKFFLKQDQVLSVHDLHVWAISTEESALTVHLEVSHDYDGSKNFLDFLTEEIKEKFSIGHVTIQIEKVEKNSTPCGQSC